jgi:hypothetical protein
LALEKLERIAGFGECGEGVAYGEEGDFFVGVENGEAGRGVVIHGEVSP